MTIFKSNNISIFPVGFGAMPLSLPGRPTEKRAIETLHTFLDLGGNLIDTADVYGIDGSDIGHNEKLIHSAIRNMKRSDMIISTKGGATRPNGGWSFIGGGHPAHIRQACEASLLNLKIEQHTLYYLHGVDPAVPIEESLGTIIDLKNEGKIINIGIANVNLADIHTASRLTPIFAVQNRLNPFCKGDLNNGVMNHCKEHKIYYIAYCPLGGFADHVKLNKSVLFKSLCQKYKLSSYIISLVWILSKGKHVIPIPGMHQADHVKENLNAVHIDIDPADLAKLDQFPDLYHPIHVDQSDSDRM